MVIWYVEGDKAMWKGEDGKVYCEKWYWLPYVVSYGVSGTVLHLDVADLIYKDVTGTQKVSGEVYMERPEMFRNLSSERYKVKMVCLMINRTMEGLGNKLVPVGIAEVKKSN